jgi:hypothetical protein
MAMLIAGAILLNPHVWLQDMALMALIAALGFVACREQPARRSLWLIAGALVWISQDASPQAITNGVNVVTPVILAMLLLLLLQLRQARSASRSASHPQDGGLAQARAA